MMNVGSPSSGLKSNFQHVREPKQVQKQLQQAASLFSTLTVSVNGAAHGPSKMANGLPLLKLMTLTEQAAALT